MAKTILIVDDEADLRSPLATALRNEGFEVAEAEDGAEGLKTALEKKPDLIILDLVMPKMNGFEVLERLRADDWGKQARVMMLTVLEAMENVSRAIEWGSTDYLVKNHLTLGEIVEKVKEKIGT